MQRKAYTASVEKERRRSKDTVVSIVTKLILDSLSTKSNSKGERDNAVTIESTGGGKIRPVSCLGKHRAVEEATGSANNDDADVAADDFRPTRRQ